MGQTEFLWNAEDLNIPQGKGCWNSRDPVSLGKSKAAQDREQAQSDKESSEVHRKKTTDSH